MRFYGFEVDEIVEGPDGLLALDKDPKLAWALRHRERFPLDLNRADRSDLLRTPGLGKILVDKIIAARRVRAVTMADLARLRAPVAKIAPFVVVPDHRPTRTLDRLDLERRLAQGHLQLAFDL
jgi:predicted DNA-binding helix-hairpin-helix protein